MTSALVYRQGGIECRGCGALAASGRTFDLASGECWCDWGSCPRCGTPATAAEWREEICSNCDGPVAQEGAE